MRACITINAKIYTQKIYKTNLHKHLYIHIITCKYINNYINKYFHTYLYTNAYTDIIIYMYVSIYVHTKVNICICGNIQINKCTYVRTFKYTSMRTCILISIHAYTKDSFWHTKTLIMTNFNNYVHICIIIRA